MLSRKLLLCNFWLSLLSSIPCVFPVAAVPPIEDAPFYQDYREAYPLGSPGENDVRSITVDPSGTVWVATAGGVRRLKEGQWQIPPGADGSGPAFSILADSQGQVWFGAWNGIYSVGEEGIRKEGADGAAIAAIGGSRGERNEKETLYAGGPEGVWTRRETDWERCEGKWADSIHDLLGGRDGSFWIATGTGLVHHRPDGSEEVFPCPESLLSTQLHCLAWDPSGQLVVGGSGGIDFFDGNKRVKSLTTSQGLPNHRARAIAFDSEGRLWVATELGVARYDGNTWSLRHSLRWLPSDDARDVALDKDGTAWVATAAGVSAIKRRKMTLADKADFYLQAVRARNIRPPGLLGPAILKAPGDLSETWVTDTDNDGLFTGIYCAMECFRYAVTRAPDALANAREAFNSLELLQTVTGTSHFIARTVIPIDAQPQSDLNRTYSGAEAAGTRLRDSRAKVIEKRWLPSADGRWLWKRDASSDEVVGHMFAYAAFHELAADASEKERVSALVARIIGGVIDHGFCLRDIDGKATRWGVWAPELINGDMDWREQKGNNSVEILSFLALARHVTGDSRFAEAARLLIEQHGYATNTLHSKASAPSEADHIVDQLLALTYPSLLAWETDPKLREIYQEGMHQWHATIAQDHSPLYDLIYNRFSGDQVPLEGAAEILRDWPLDLVEWTVDNRFREDVGLDKTPGLREPQTERLLPPSERGLAQWDHNPFSPVRGSSGLRQNTGDTWLICYWMGRYYGFIGPPLASSANPAEKKN